MPPIVEAHQLHKRFGKVRALDGLDLVAEPGQVVALLGPNGAGKTTFVRAIATLVRPDAGELRVAGVDARRHPDQVRRSIGLAGQYAGRGVVGFGLSNDERRGATARFAPAFSIAPPGGPQPLSPSGAAPGAGPAAPRPTCSCRGGGATRPAGSRRRPPPCAGRGGGAPARWPWLPCRASCGSRPWRCWPAPTRSGTCSW